MLEKIKDDKEWKRNKCADPEHNPPGYIVLENGRYKHTCPGCGHVQVFTVNNPVLNQKSSAVVKRGLRRLANKKSKYIPLNKFLAKCK